MTKRFLFLLLVLFSLFPRSSVFAQNPIVFSKAVINIWPEFDQPGVLVIYRFTLSPQTNLPATLTLRIPKAAGSPYTVAMKNTEGRLDNLRSTQEIEGDWINVTLSTPVPEIQLEYYDPDILINGTDHKFNYLWPADYAVENALLIVRKPLTAENFQILPAMGSGQTSSEGYTDFELSIGELKPGFLRDVSLTYNKTGSELSAPLQTVFPAEPITTETPGWQSLSEVLPFILGGLGFLLILAGGYWYWRSGKTLSNTFRKRHNPNRSKALENEVVEIYCHSCGRKAIYGDVYCRACGTKLRIE